MKFKKKSIWMCNILKYPKEAIYTSLMALTNHVNYQTVVKICQNSIYCVSSTVEI
jgi:hypothetical protein